jgi:hypothetical protein
MALSASRARFVIKFFGFWCRLYLSPLFSSLYSLSVNAMLVLLTILG